MELDAISSTNSRLLAIARSAIAVPSTAVAVAAIPLDPAGVRPDLRHHDVHLGLVGGVDLGDEHPQSTAGTLQPQRLDPITLPAGTGG
jgi:hypothetical protein